MKILAADDEELALDLLTETIKEVAPDASVYSFIRPSRLLDFAQSNPCDVAFLDINMCGMSGLSLAAKLKQCTPKINIIFVTGYDEYIGDAMQMHASGYITKPVTAKSVAAELEDLRHPVFAGSKALLKLRCFGNFDVYTMNGVPVHFERSKAKEALAYLVSKFGTSCSIKEIAATIFEDREYDKKQQGYMQKIISSMVQSLKDVGAEDIVRKNYNSLSINPEIVDCDYYRFMHSDPEMLHAYSGEFMALYSWAEDAVGYLEKIYWANE